MIRTPENTLISKFLSESFIDAISFCCDVDKIAPLDDAHSAPTEEEWQAIDELFVIKVLGRYTGLFKDVGGVTFVRKKIAELIKIAKAKGEVQMDLISELILYLIGTVNAYCLVDYGAPLRFYFNKKDELLERCLAVFDFLNEDKLRRERKRLENVFTSFFTLMEDDTDEYVYWDWDFLFLFDYGIPAGTYMMKFAGCDYDREWYEMAWTNVGEEVPLIVTFALNAAGLYQ